MEAHYEAMHGSAQHMSSKLASTVSQGVHEQQDTAQLLTKKKRIKLLARMDASCACGRAAKKTSGGKRKAPSSPRDS